MSLALLISKALSKGTQAFLSLFLLFIVVIRYVFNFSYYLLFLLYQNIMHWPCQKNIFLLNQWVIDISVFVIRIGYVKSLLYVPKVVTG